MPSKIIGKIAIDHSLLNIDLNTIINFPVLPEAYAEFGVGSWRNHSLWNKTGDFHDMQVQDSDEPAQVTALGKQLPYISKLIRETFDTTHLKMVRARNLTNGCVFPHRDFVELSHKSHYLRVFLPLQSNLQSYHSDEQSVFQMQCGEIWQLDASMVHAAANFGEESRIHICLDFQFAGEKPPVEVVFLDPKTAQQLPAPTQPVRKPLANFPQTLNEMSKTFDETTLHSMIVALSKLHFLHTVHVADCYDWLIAMAEKTGSKTLIETCQRLKTFMIVKRAIGEQFSFQSAQTVN